MTSTITGHVQVCLDCMFWLEGLNDDPHPRMADVVEWWHRWDPETLTLDPTDPDYPSEGFSCHWCDMCDSLLGGERYRYAVWV